MALMTKSLYSPLDQALHRLAFASASLQEAFEDIERVLYGKEWQTIKLTSPIFITSLPRAGTTTLLEALHKLPGTATHTYRDMPFIYAPVAWERLTGRFRKKNSSKERAHGDKLLINEDSPEAFEEIIWRRFFPAQFKSDNIELLEKASTNFCTYFLDHMRKIALLRCPAKLESARYISKNNGNISRISAIQKTFPNASIVVPVRNPIDHAFSLWHQHSNFTKQHNQDRFTQRYMADIGHYEFGTLHKPISFHGMGEVQQSLKPDQADYWLHYWLCAFRHLMNFDNIHIIAYEQLCINPESQLHKLSEKTQIMASSRSISTAASIFREPARIEQSKGDKFSQTLKNDALKLYQKLLSIAI